MSLFKIFNKKKKPAINNAYREEVRKQEPKKEENYQEKENGKI